MKIMVAFRTGYTNIAIVESRHVKGRKKWQWEDRIDVLVYIAKWGLVCINIERFP